MDTDSHGGSRSTLNVFYEMVANSVALFRYALALEVGLLSVSLFLLFLVERSSDSYIILIFTIFILLSVILPTAAIVYFVNGPDEGVGPY